MTTETHDAPVHPANTPYREVVLPDATRARRRYLPRIIAILTLATAGLSAAATLYLGAMISEMTSLRPYRTMARDRSDPDRPPLVESIRQFGRRHGRAVYVAPGIASNAHLAAGMPEGSVDEMVRALDTYAAGQGLWFHERDGVFRLEREVTSVDFDCRDRLERCIARLARVASVEIRTDSVSTDRSVEIRVRSGEPVVETVRDQLTRAGYTVDVTGRTLFLAQPAPAAAVENRASADECWRPNEIRNVGTNRFQISRRALDCTLANPAELMRSARLIPERRHGREVGVRIFGIRRDSVLARLGFRNGDVLVSINGYEVASPDRCLEAYTRLRTTDVLSVEVESAGRRVTRVYEIVASASAA